MKAQQQLTREAQEETLGKETYKNEASKSTNNLQGLSEIDIPA
ncbi:MAG: hypothetical protein U9R50_04075 [Campylobacterota bacterium]|nr:hypothetical protein [Campylobacterota bacterium]